MRGRPSAFVLMPSLIACWIGFAQVLAFNGVMLWVITASLAVVAVMTLALRSGRRLLGLFLGVVIATGWATLAETYGGSNSGPITRSAILAGGLTIAMVALLHTRYPLTMLGPALCLLGSTLALGSSGPMVLWFGLAAVAAALTVLMLGPYREADLADRRRLLPVAAVLIAVGLATVAGSIMASPHLGSAASTPTVIDPADPGLMLNSAGIEPAVTSGVTPALTSVATTAAPPPVAPNETPELIPLWLVIVIALGVSVVIYLLPIVIWMLAKRVLMWWRWRMVRRRLRSGAAPDRVIGSWTWVRMRLALTDRPLPPSASPDVAVGWARSMGDPDLARVAALVARIAFNPLGEISMPDSALAWDHARVVDRFAGRGSLRQRWAWAARSPRAYQP